ncbi:PREDICTED: inositol-trisphosphate 3-kinase A-like, partial [Rhagoletis zephyria]|uniref:inositol-trisphosphate 3-kinase A-like n=1 Tax=Rhagoletis zephyria TaxID=28612 RepID=UPI0008118135
TSPWRKVRSLVTSPFIQTYKRQKYPWIQLAGHQGNFLAGQMQGTILKKKSGNEDKCFQALMEDELRHFVPHFKNVVHMNGESYIELEDLLASFSNPSIMDIKMGIRTYLEEELIKAGEKPKLRKDMYEKMVAIDPREPTEEEHALRAVTKPRYMVWRESISSTSTLGFRIDGVKLRQNAAAVAAAAAAGNGNSAECENNRTNKDFKRTKTEQSVSSAILQFAEEKPECI